MFQLPVPSGKDDEVHVILRQGFQQLVKEVGAG